MSQNFATLKLFPGTRFPSSCTFSAFAFTSFDFQPCAVLSLVLEKAICLLNFLQPTITIFTKQKTNILRSKLQERGKRGFANQVKGVSQEDCSSALAKVFCKEHQDLLV